jgi:hypothetical protein
MLKAYYSLLKVIAVERGVGVRIHDVLRGNTGFLADISLSTSAREDMIIATRVIPHEGFLTTGGAVLPVPGEAVTRIASDLARMFPPATDLTRLTPEQEARLAARLIRTCLDAEGSSHVAYAEPNQHASSGSAVGALSTRPRANRNDPCPCGSGRKYKTCCGKR